MTAAGVATEDLSSGGSGPSSTDDPAAKMLLAKSSSLPVHAARDVERVPSCGSNRTTTAAATTTTSTTSVRRHHGAAAAPEAVGAAGSGGRGAAVTATTSTATTMTATLGQHYYPEGGWGWPLVAAVSTVNLLAKGLQYSYGLLVVHIMLHFHTSIVHAAWLGSVCLGSSQLIRPIIVATCRQHSIRIVSVVGALVLTLACLFASFATRYHQLLLSFGLLLGIGVGVTTEAADLIVGQYFKRRRQVVEVVTNLVTCLGIVCYSFILNNALRSIGWRLGLQSVTGMLFTTLLMGLCYRSASLYHPQRRAIQHLKNQRRKVKEKVSHKKTTVKPPFFDLTVLQARSLRVLIICCAISSLGIFSPIVFLVYILKSEGLDEELTTLLQTYMGVAMALGNLLFGYVVVQQSPQCRIATNYLAHICLICVTISLVALTYLQGYDGYVLCVFMYGIFMGGYLYCIKMYLYHNVKTSNFAKAWAFLQASMAIPTFIGIGITGHIMSWCGAKAGLYFCIASTSCSSLVHFIILSMQSSGGGGTLLLSSSSSSAAPMLRYSSSGNMAGPEGGGRSRSSPIGVVGHSELCKCRDVVVRTLDDRGDVGDDDDVGGGDVDGGGGHVEGAADCLTCISEEGVVENFLLDDLYHENCITSCNKVEKYLMMSELENNARTRMKSPAGAVRVRNTIDISTEEEVVAPCVEDHPH